MNYLIKILAIAVLFSVSSFVMAGDPAAGKTIAKTTCAACHGLTGSGEMHDENESLILDSVTQAVKMTPPTNPKLAGQYKDYLEQALTDYKSGARKDPIMSGQAASLSEQDIENLAAWFASQDSLNILPKDPIGE